MNVAYGHDLYGPTPEGIFILKWAWDPTLIFFVVMGILYIRGLRAFKGRSPVATWQKVLFFSGLAVVATALLPPIDPLSDQLFFMHMIQHMMITSIGVPLMIFGVPFFVTLRGMPPWFKRKIYIPFIRNRWLSTALAFIQKPIPALVLFEANFWFWHIPKYYNLALLNDALHLVEHAFMAFTAMNLWRVIIDPKPMRSPLRLPMRILFLGFITALDVMLSAALTFSESVWYAYEGLPEPTWWSWGPLQDQRLGGLIMWVPGGAIWFLTMTAIFFVWVHREQQRELLARDGMAQKAKILPSGV